MEDDTITPKRALGNGKWDRALKKRMVDLSKSDNYDEAKHEWIATGQVWWRGLNSEPPSWVTQHSDKCLCGHNIVYHFEIHNTETDVRECVGSDHINSYLILRAIKEETGLSVNQITDEMIVEWIDVRVSALKRNAWWELNGDEFTKMFNAVKDLDLRVNVRTSGRYYDSQLRMYRDKTFIRKRSEGNFGESFYKMASIVWRWNHPENPKAQINRAGYPNQRLYNDLLMFYFSIEEADALIKKEDDFRKNRIDELEKEDVLREQLRQEQINRRLNRVKQVKEVIFQPAFEEACEYYGVKPFISEQGNDAWEENFLKDIKVRMIRGQELSEKQVAKLVSVLNKERSEPQEATSKQKNYLRRLGYEGELDDITKAQASDEITKLKKQKWG